VNKKNIIWIVAAVVAVAAAVTAIIVFHRQIADFFSKVKSKLSGNEQQFTSEEFEDFADI
jgi:hypothetical protein